MDSKSDDDDFYRTPGKIEQRSLFYIPVKVNRRTYEITPPQRLDHETTFHDLSLNDGDSVVWEFIGLDPADRPIVVYGDALAGRAPFRRVLQQGHVIIGHEFHLETSVRENLEKRRAILSEYGTEELRRQLRDQIKMARTSGDDGNRLNRVIDNLPLPSEGAKLRVGYRVSVIRGDGLAVQLPYATALYGSDSAGGTQTPREGAAITLRES